MGDLTARLGPAGHALNTNIFIPVWKKVVDDQWHKSHKWIVKVDPDSVFLSSRLRPLVAGQDDAGVFNNCYRNGFPKLDGPIEVVSAKAMNVLEADYAKSSDGKVPHDCVSWLDWNGTGPPAHEGAFLKTCLSWVHKMSDPMEEKLLRRN